MARNWRSAQVHDPCLIIGGIAEKAQIGRDGGQKPRHLAYIRSKICGRKFIDDQNVNYFLYQDGLVKTPKEKSADPIVQAIDALSPPNPNFPTFFEVLNNEVFVVDAKKDIREIKISSYILEKDFPKKADFTFAANCQSNSYSVKIQGKPNVISGNVEGKETLSAVAFNRACGDHGAYMKTSTKFSK